MVMVNGLREALERGQVCELSATDVAVAVSAGALNKHTVTIVFVTLDDAAYLMEGLVSGRLALHVANAETSGV